MGIRSAAHLDRLLWAHLSGPNYVAALVDDVLVGLVEHFQHRLNAFEAFGKCRGLAVKSHRLPTGQSCDQIL